MPAHKMARWKCRAGSYDAALEAATEAERGNADGKGTVRWFLAKLEEAFAFEGGRGGVNVHNYGEKRSKSNGSIETRLTASGSSDVLFSMRPSHIVFTIKKAPILTELQL
jgi:hypothetical protein